MAAQFGKGRKEREKKETDEKKRRWWTEQSKCVTFACKEPGFGQSFIFFIFFHSLLQEELIKTLVYSEKCTSGEWKLLQQATPKCQSLNGVLEEGGGVSVCAGSCIGVLGWACSEDAASFSCSCILTVFTVFSPVTCTLKLGGVRDALFCPSLGLRF